MNQKELVPEVFDNELYNNMQIFMMKIYLKMCIDSGDCRDHNEILAEWIKENSANFRAEWCKHQQKVSA